MMIKTLCCGISNPYRFPVAATSYNFTIFNLKHRISVIQDNRRFYYLSHQNYSMNNTRRSLLLIQDILKNKVTFTTTTASATADKAKQNSTKTDPDNSTVTPLTAGQKLKKAVKEYGSTVIVFHIVISLMSLGICYLLVTSGLDITKVLTWLGLEEWMGKSRLVNNAGTFAVAYAIHKVFAPVRITITLASVPLIVKHLRKNGFLKK